jgi:hypothetical protein
MGKGESFPVKGRACLWRAEPSFCEMQMQWSIA